MSGSLYNMLFGTNKFADVLLKMLGTERDQVPRFRDCFVSDDGKMVVIHTRTGGGNRDFYEDYATCQKNFPDYVDDMEADQSGPWNSTLRELPGFIRDEDDDFDPTYANFYYEIPESCREYVTALEELGAKDNPAEKWKKLLTDMQDKEPTDPITQNAIALGRSILARIEEVQAGESREK
jgi:hypothetical protein